MRLYLPGSVRWRVRRAFNGAVPFVWRRSRPPQRQARPVRTNVYVDGQSVYGALRGANTSGLTCCGSPSLLRPRTPSYVSAISRRSYPVDARPGRGTPTGVLRALEATPDLRFTTVRFASPRASRPEKKGSGRQISPVSAAGRVRSRYDVALVVTNIDLTQSIESWDALSAFAWACGAVLNRIRTGAAVRAVTSASRRLPVPTNRRRRHVSWIPNCQTPSATAVGDHEAI